ncbi:MULTISPECIES: branched-chain amino acid ABC transporter permease [unclassified Bartonella]|uniref:branched-chain amino acid ABC transporter permease n=1 Tax=unclassified Bartonella TaxID=2645622 RepID=UPI00099AC454|nr:MULTISPECIES: branched-chain amino acid ABC transporter permease [unclassified Bartonella]AQX28036.1 amino acid/amide ABC transporter membrane protein 1, HAAT family [Bartonella sp. JB15]AQX29312.1 amino acid/amide ABC transporter membrane protein 1, HAAT family [Bartonella sp. JB63]
MSTEMFIQYFFNALALGSLYGLIAIGYTMVYGVLRLINFAHGDFLMLGAYFFSFSTISFMPAWTAILLILFAVLIYYSIFIGFKKQQKLYWISAFFILVSGLIYYLQIAQQGFKPFWFLAIYFSIFITSAVGILVDQLAYKPLRNAPRISVLIGAIGISFLIESLAIMFFSSVPKAVKQPDFLVTPILWYFGQDSNSIIRIAPMSLIVPIVSFILVIILLWIINKTKPGLAMRAISYDIETTRLMGVSVNKIIAFTFCIGSALGAIAGIMWSLRYPQIHPYMGSLPGLKAFIAAVIGGIGSIPGAMLGGLLLGFIEIMTVAFSPSLSGYRDAFAFILLILILLVMPNGLMGKKNQEKI